MQSLLHDGMALNRIAFDIRIKCFIADTPARAATKCVKGHTGFNACEKCIIRRQTIQNRRCYLDMDAVERTDRNFREKTYPDHHVGISALGNLQVIDMVKMFCLDFMYIGCLGIMKKLLDIWLGLSSGVTRGRLSDEKKEILDFMLQAINKQVPCDFQRKTDSVDHVSLWKATEFYVFLLYSGPFIMKHVLSEALYKHFLLLVAALRILCLNTLGNLFRSCRYITDKYR